MPCREGKLGTHCSTTAAKAGSHQLSLSTTNPKKSRATPVYGSHGPLAIGQGQPKARNPAYLMTGGLGGSGDPWQGVGAPVG